MNLFQKAQVLGKAGHYDSCGPKMCEVNISSGLGGIYHAKAEHKTCRIFKTLMDNNCSFDCRYCGNSNRCAKKKAKYEAEELAGLFDYLRKNMKVNGLFLSSAVSGNPDKASEKMIDAVRIIRERYHFKGYIHLKVLPGTSYEFVKQASELADRMSINIESPNEDVLSELSSCKDYHNDLIKRQRWLSKLNLGAGQTTQMIIHESSTDSEVLKTAMWEYNSFGMKRVYYSAFRPVKGTPMENQKPESVLRQNRLYNADFLLREYNYELKEIHSIMDEGMLPLEDPKTALAKTSGLRIELNEASYDELIRVTGIGPKTARKILRRKGAITKFEQLHSLGAHIGRANPFISLKGKKQSRLEEFQ